MSIYIQTNSFLKSEIGVLPNKTVRFQEKEFEPFENSEKEELKTSRPLRSSLKSNSNTNLTVKGFPYNSESARYQDILDEATDNKRVRFRMPGEDTYYDSFPNLESTRVTTPPETQMDKYEKTTESSKVLILYEDSVIQFDVVSQTLSEHPLNGVLGSVMSSFVQINDNEIVVSGGLQKDDMSMISARTALFSVKKAKLYRLKDMLTPRRNHAMVALDYYCYCICGSTQKKFDTAIVERLNLIAHEWESLNPVKYSREVPKAVVSTRYK